MNKKSRNSALAQNTLIFAIGNFASKFISFFLVPLYTACLSVKDYGKIDLVYTLGVIFVPIVSLNISDSILRFSLDKDKTYGDMNKISNRMYLLSIVFTLVCSLVLFFIPEFSVYYIYIVLYVIALTGSQIFLSLLKGNEKLGNYTVGNILNTTLIAVLNIIFLVVLKTGIKGYFLAYIISNFIIIFYVKIIGRKYIASKNKLNKDLLKNMIKYSVVLIPTSFIWWIMNSSDRIMITNMLSLYANGIYGVSYKIPTILSTIITVFNQAWFFSAVNEQKSADINNYTNDVFKKLMKFSCIIILACFVILKPFTSIYVASEYYDSWKYVPILLIGFSFQSLSTFIATSYSVKKDNKGMLFSGVFGAILNIILNFILIPYIGIYGAAISTCLSYITVFLYRAFDTRKYVKIKIFSFDCIITYIIMFLAGLVVYIPKSYALYVSLSLLIIYLLINYKEVIFIINLLRGGLMKKWKRN